MNKKHFQPGLIISGDYVYAFSSLCDKKEENNYFERTDLTSKNPKWEKINPIFPNKKIKVDINTIQLLTKFFYLMAKILKFLFGIKLSIVSIKTIELEYL